MTTDATNLPTDIYPGEDELRLAIALDELCREINRTMDEDVELLCNAIMTRLDRLERSA